MEDKGFFNKQTALTASKTLIYEQYIKVYLPKLVSTFGKIFIADLFCGPGMNGEKKGSPLILIDSINYIFSSEIFKKISDKKVSILFNDQDPKFIESLNFEIKRLEYNKNEISIRVENQKYEFILPSLLSSLHGDKTPKFFFLDPFTYSNVKMSDLKELMNLPNTEVLLFIPVFHTYRFANANFTETHETRKFIEEYTLDGMMDYEDIHVFMDSIRNKLIENLQIPYVRSVLLDGGGSKNSLFLLSKHIKGMLAMNKIAFKITDDGNCVSTKNIGQASLFNTNDISVFYKSFCGILRLRLQEKVMSNFEIVEFTISNGYLPRHAKQELESLLLGKKIVVFDNKGEKIMDKRKWRISEEALNTQNHFADVFFKWINL